MNIKKICTSVVLLTFLANTLMPQPALAQGLSPILPAPGTMVGLSPSFQPVLLKGMIADAKDPFKLEFIVDKGSLEKSDARRQPSDVAGQDAPGGSTPSSSDVQRLTSDDLKSESTRLIKYFLAALTTPENDLWVNLSPVEKDRIVPDAFGRTAMGRDLLAQDYLLKQITASLLHPDSPTGKNFWDKVYKKTFEEFGTTDIPIDTFNKVWITPDTARIYTNGNKAYIVDCKMKVLLESDYLALKSSDVGRQTSDQSSVPAPDSSQVLARDILREVMVPILTKEVNEGDNFAPLRQIYHSLVLAAWFKRKLKESLLQKAYADQNKNAGLEFEGLNEQEIYQQYLEAYQKGVFNFIREESETLDEGRQTSDEKGIARSTTSDVKRLSSDDVVIPRKYFSGGFTASKNALEAAMSLTEDPLDIPADKTAELATVNLIQPDGNKVRLTQPVSSDAAQNDRGLRELKPYDHPDEIAKRERRAAQAKKNVQEILYKDLALLAPQARSAFLKAHDALDQIRTAFSLIQGDNARHLFTGELAALDKYLLVWQRNDLTVGPDIISALWALEQILNDLNDRSDQWTQTILSQKEVPPTLHLAARELREHPERLQQIRSFRDTFLPLAATIREAVTALESFPHAPDGTKVSERTLPFSPDHDMVAPTGTNTDNTATPKEGISLHEYFLQNLHYSSVLSEGSPLEVIEARKGDNDERIQSDLVGRAASDLWNALREHPEIKPDLEETADLFRLYLEKSALRSLFNWENDLKFALVAAMRNKPAIYLDLLDRLSSETNIQNVTSLLELYQAAFSDNAFPEPLTQKDILFLRSNVFRKHSLDKSWEIGILNTIYSKRPDLVPDEETASLFFSGLSDANLRTPSAAALQRLGPERVLQVIAQNLGAEEMPNPSLAASGEFARISDPENRVALIKEEDPGLYNLVFNPGNARRILALATTLRTIYPYEDTRDRSGTESPLDWAIRNKMYFPLGSGYYISPATESFRRHLIFRLNEDESRGKVLEIKIPGDIPDENHRIVEESDITLAAKVRARWPDARMAIPVAFLSLPEDDYRLYNQVIHFGKQEKVNKSCNIAVFEYADGRRVTNLSVDDLKAIAHDDQYSDRYQGDPKAVVKDIAHQAYRILAMLHILGYHGAHSDGTDAHMENFRLLPGKEGITVEAVDDLSSFTQWFGTPEADVDYLAQGSSRIWGLANLLPRNDGLTVADCEDIYRKELAGLTSLSENPNIAKTAPALSDHAQTDPDRPKAATPPLSATPATLSDPAMRQDIFFEKGITRSDLASLKNPKTIYSGTADILPFGEDAPHIPGISSVIANGSLKKLVNELILNAVRATWKETGYRKPRVTVKSFKDDTVLKLTIQQDATTLKNWNNIHQRADAFSTRGPEGLKKEHLPWGLAQHNGFHTVALLMEQLPVVLHYQRDPHSQAITTELVVVLTGFPDDNKTGITDKAMATKITLREYFAQHPSMPYLQANETPLDVIVKHQNDEDDRIQIDLLGEMARILEKTLDGNLQVIPGNDEAAKMFDILMSPQNRWSNHWRNIFMLAFVAAIKNAPYIYEKLLTRLSTETDFQNLNTLLLLLEAVIQKQSLPRPLTSDDVSFLKKDVLDRMKMGESWSINLLETIYTNSPQLTPSEDDIRLFLTGIKTNFFHGAARHVLQTKVAPKTLLPLIATEGLPDPNLTTDRSIKGMLDPEKQTEVLYNEDPQLFNLIFNPENVRKLLPIMTTLRAIYPYLTKNEHHGIEGPLTYAIKNNIVFPLGEGLYLSPVTQSFRRHVIFRMEADGTIPRAFEIKIPGEIDDETHRIIDPNDIELAAKLRQRWPAAQVAIPVAFVPQPSGTYRMYGENMRFGPQENINTSLNISVFKHHPGSRVTNLSEDDILWIAQKYQKYNNDPRKVLEDIARQSYRILAMLHILGYHGTSITGTDSHMENYRIILDTNGIRIESVADFLGFTTENNLPLHDVDFMATGTGSIKGLTTLLRNGMTPRECAAIYQEELTALKGNSFSTTSEHAMQQDAQPLSLEYVLLTTRDFKDLALRTPQGLIPVRFSREHDAIVPWIETLQKKGFVSPETTLINFDAHPDTVEELTEELHAGTWIRWMRYKKMLNGRAIWVQWPNSERIFEMRGKSQEELQYGYRGRENIFSSSQALSQNVSGPALITLDLDFLAPNYEHMVSPDIIEDRLNDFVQSVFLSGIKPLAFHISVSESYLAQLKDYPPVNMTVALSRMLDASLQRQGISFQDINPAEQAMILENTAPRPASHLTEQAMSIDEQKKRIQEKQDQLTDYARTLADRFPQYPWIDWVNASLIPWPEVVRDKNATPDPGSEYDAMFGTATNRWNYWANQLDLRKLFLKTIADGLSSPLSNETIMPFLRKGHRTLIFGEDNDSPYIPQHALHRDILPDELHIQQLAKKMQMPLSEVPAFLEHIAQTTPYLQKIAHTVYLTEQGIRTYHHQLTNLIDVLKTGAFEQSTTADPLFHLARLTINPDRTLSPNDYLFDYGNLSFVMNLINAFIRLSGKTGLRHGDFDHSLIKEELETARRKFQDLLSEAEQAMAKAKEDPNDASPDKQKERIQKKQAALTRYAQTLAKRFPQYPWLKWEEASLLPWQEAIRFPTTDIEPSPYKDGTFGTAENRWNYWANQIDQRRQTLTFIANALEQPLSVQALSEFLVNSHSALLLGEDRNSLYYPEHLQEYERLFPKEKLAQLAKKTNLTPDGLSAYLNHFSRLINFLKQPSPELTPWMEDLFNLDALLIRHGNSFSPEVYAFEYGNHSFGMNIINTILKLHRHPGTRQGDFDYDIIEKDHPKAFNKFQAMLAKKESAMAQIEQRQRIKEKQADLKRYARTLADHFPQYPRIDWINASLVPWQEIVRETTKQTGPESRTNITFGNPENRWNYWANQIDLRKQLLTLLADGLEKDLSEESISTFLAEGHKTLLLGEARDSLYYTEYLLNYETAFSQQEMLQIAERMYLNADGLSAFRYHLSRIISSIKQHTSKIPSEPQDLFHLMTLILHPKTLSSQSYAFEFGNLSFAMNITNTILKLQGHPGTRNGDFDHALFHNQPEEAFVKFQKLIAEHDSAITKDLGGIDMNPEALSIEETGSPSAIQNLSADPAGLPVITGLVPLILDMRPISNLRELLTAPR